MSKDKSEEKQYSLKAIEVNVINNINSRHNAELLDFLAFIALERLAIPVTENTRFRIDEDGKLYVSEVEPEKEEKAEEVAVA